jgi:atypical dual specificity phosphatase
MNLPVNFSFIWKKKLAGSGHPGRGQSLSTSLAALEHAGIRAVLSLTEAPLDLAPIREFQVEYLHVPIDDFTAPTAQQIEEAVKFLGDQFNEGHGVLVHCLAGIGRTGTILACFLVSQGMSANEAIQYVRQRRPGSLEVYEQEYCVHQYAARLDRDTPDSQKG